MQPTTAVKFSHVLKQCMAWSYQYLLLSLFGFSNQMRLLLKAFARLTGFWLKYFDYLTRWNPYQIEAASGFYFLGKKSTRRLSDAAVLRYYEETIKRS